MIVPNNWIEGEHEEAVRLLVTGHTVRSAEKTANSNLITFHLFLNLIDLLLACRDTGYSNDRGYYWQC